MNRPPVLNVTSASQIQAAFAQPPAGYTPTVLTLHKVMAHKNISAEKKLLLILCTYFIFLHNSKASHNNGIIFKVRTESLLRLMVRQISMDLSTGCVL